ncbi:galactoside alpha-(1,2)-fucosyltransferase 2-like [Ylistrum balloti]|uniref:galactoside alpha-(1,2)-fucosyltransferase 2-like n=1 Tax=Ylistrum balloti TaxID=509963 RepID=UPI002905DCF1|nr:galactoside alpha-(1,2)-fucosyltransferase 2-like [Ylistrum balloti]
MEGEQLRFRKAMKPRLNFQQKSICLVSYRTCAICIFILSVMFLVLSNLVSYSALTHKAGLFHQYVLNMSDLTANSGNNSSRKTLGWMSPAVISKKTIGSSFRDKLQGNSTLPTSSIAVGTQRQNKREFSQNVFLKNKKEDFRKTHFMTVEGKGRLGNQMFQFAALLGVSALHNYLPFVPPNHRIAQFFDIAEVRVIKMLNSQGHGEERAGAFDSRIHQLSHSKNWTLHGYFQSWKYFDHIANDVRKAFRFKPSIFHKAFTKLKALNASITVGVHIRRGDMNSKIELSRGYNVADEIFVKKALTFFRSKLKNPIFVMIGDDAAWMMSKFSYADIKIATSGSAAVDLAIMSQCNHSIVTSGTYGWWGAYLAGGETVYFRDYPKPGSWLDKQYNRADYYPSNWIGMS